MLWANVSANFDTVGRIADVESMFSVNVLVKFNVFCHVADVRIISW